MSRRWCTSLLVAVCILACAADAGESAQRRTADRQARITALKSLPDVIARAQSSYINTMTGTCNWLIGLNAKADAAALVVEIQGADPKAGALEDLKKKLDAIVAGAVLDEAKQKELATKLAAARKARATAYTDVAATYYRTGLARKAAELLVEALQFDPDNATARGAFGEAKAGTEWKDAFAAQQIQKGAVYVPDFGWVSAAGAERAKNGEWLEKGKWIPVAEADKLHADAANPWVIETAHFTLRSTASLKDTVGMAERMEGIWQVACREYPEFFLREKRGQKMSFTFAPAKKMVSHVFAKKADYDAIIKKEFKGPVQGLLLILPGLYVAQNHASYFHREIPEMFVGPFLQNQWTGQILGEYSQTPAGGVKPFVSSALCDGLQPAAADEKGRWSVPHGRQHPAVAKAAELAGQGQLPFISTISNLEFPMFNATQGNAQIAAAFGRFMLETQDGAYALDFLEYCYDAYRSPKTANLSDYIGMDPGTIEKSFDEYLKKP